MPSENLPTGHNLMGEFESSAETPFEVAAAHTEAEILDMAAVIEEEIEALNDAIAQAKATRATKLARITVLYQARSLAADKGLE